MSAATEVRNVHDDDRPTHIDTLRGQARELRSVLDHEGRIQVLEYQLIDLRKADVDTRIETNQALREMAKEIGAQGIRKWYERVAIIGLLTLCSLCLAASAAIGVLQYLQGAR